MYSQEEKFNDPNNYIYVGNVLFFFNLITFFTFFSKLLSLQKVRVVTPISDHF